MKINDYVRFDYHRVSTPIQIAKITKINYDSEDNNICYSTDIGLVINKSNLVKKPSPDIIDLLEPMDLLYIDIDGGFEGGIIVPRTPETQNELNEYIEKIKSGEYILKGVVTHEQLDKNTYWL